METGTKITKIKLFECGYCINHMRHLFKKEKDRKIRFGAWVAYIEHSELGGILFDTGYSPLWKKNGLISFIYGLLNPTFCNEEDTIIHQLQDTGIPTSNVHKIILSHAHPDHMGALPLFLDYELISSQEVLHTLASPSLMDLVFKSLKPNKGIKQTSLKPTIHDNEDIEMLKRYFQEVYDVITDGSILGVKLDGHAKGQIGIYIPEHQVLFAADASWRDDFLSKLNLMKRIPRFIQKDINSYYQTITKIEQFQKAYPHIQVIFTHGENGGIKFD